MKTRHVTSFVALSALVSILCWAGLTITVTEDFEGTLADALWRTGPGDEIVPDGGNPGAFLRDPAATAPMPVIATDVPSVFTGPYKQMGVDDFGIDVNVFAVSGETGDRPVSLGLVGSVYAGGTYVDCELVLLGTRAPQPGSGWASYNFAVPAWKRHMPPKWVARGACAGLPPDDVWYGVMSHVAAARFYLGDPGVSYDSQVWDIGFDNARITIGKKGAGPTASGGPAVPMSVAPDPGE